MVANPPSNTVIESALATLQPIRDLSRNWDVDIASCLEEYLQELVGVSSTELIQAHTSSESENEADAVPNFAHAALILQNSSHVYSRKVEYLHSLVYKALYEFFKSTSANSKESRRKSADASIDDFYDFDPHEDFLLLDDMVPEDSTNRKINLKEDDEDEDTLGVYSNTPINQSLTRTRLSLGGLSVTRAERSSIGGLASSSQQRALLGTLNNGSLRLVDGRCDVGEDGVLLMPGSQSSQPTAPFTSGNEAEGGRRSLFGDDTGTPMETQANTDDLDDDHSNSGPGFVMNEDDDDEAQPPMMNEYQAPQEVVVLEHRGNGPTKRVTFSEQHVRPKRADPWTLLDPHSSEGSAEKPLRKGKTYKLPEGIDLPPSECVTGASTRRAPQRRITPPKEKSRPSVAVEILRANLGKQSDPPEIPTNGLIFGDEFTYVAKANAKKRAAKKRAERKKTLEEQLQVVGEYDDDDDNDNDGGGFYFGGDDDLDDENNDIGNAGMASLNDAFQNIPADGEDSNLGKTFEELCRAHIQAFAKGAEDFALNTQLSDRVGKWQSKLAPILEEEERRATFDIHKYSEKLLETAQQGLQGIKRKSDGSQHASTKTVNFESVTNNCTQSDVCRLFLASLSLANAGNLDIQEGASSFRFDLVSGTVALPMETYRAPSLVEGT